MDKLNKQTLIAITILLAVIFAGGFVLSKNWQKEGFVPKEQVKQQQEMLASKDQTMVWYEIPELGIKFWLEKEMADKIGYRDEYAEKGKTGGVELYVKDYPAYPYNQGLDSFGVLVIYSTHDIKTLHLESCRGNKCCPADQSIAKLLFKKGDRFFCYLDAAFSIEINKRHDAGGSIYERLDPISQKLFDGFLKEALVEEMNSGQHKI